MVVNRTDGGKSLILFLTAFSVSGVSLIIVPLLSLTANRQSNHADQKRRAEEVSSEAHHLDDLSPSVVKEKIIPRMDNFDHRSSSVMFCFCLCTPQYLAGNSFFRDAHLRAHGRRIPRLMAIDETHLYAAHGRSFQENIRVLVSVIFSKIFGNDGISLCFDDDGDNDSVNAGVFGAKLTCVDWTKKITTALVICQPNLTALHQHEI